MSRRTYDLPTPGFPLNHDPGSENDSFGLQGSGSPLKQADFSRGFSAALRSRLPLRKHTKCPRENSFPPGFLIHRSPRREIPARKNWGWTRNLRFYSVEMDLFCGAKRRNKNELNERQSRHLRDWRKRIRKFSLFGNIPD
jgi:hypothetical protein